MTTTELDVWELTSLLCHETNDITAWVREGEGTFLLHWTDGINEWVESFPTLSIAVLRLASLIACGENDWDKGFTDSPTQFIQKAGNFLSHTVG